MLSLSKHLCRVTCTEPVEVSRGEPKRGSLNKKRHLLGDVFYLNPFGREVHTERSRGEPNPSAARQGEGAMCVPEDLLFDIKNLPLFINRGS